MPGWRFAWPEPIHEARQEVGGRDGAPQGFTLTVAEHLTRWISGRMDASTNHSYAAHIRHHQIQHLGQLPLNELSVAHIESMFAAIAQRNLVIPQDGRNLSPGRRSGGRGQECVVGDELAANQASVSSSGPSWPDTVRLRIPVPGGGFTFTDVDFLARQSDGSAWQPLRRVPPVQKIAEKAERHRRHARRRL